jgi:hypothetical protein
MGTMVALTPFTMKTRNIETIEVPTLESVIGGASVTANDAGLPGIEGAGALVGPGEVFDLDRKPTAEDNRFTDELEAKLGRKLPRGTLREILNMK